MTSDDSSSELRINRYSATLTESMYNTTRCDNVSKSNAVIRKLILFVPNQPKVVVLPGQTIVIGRMPEADLCVSTDKLISRRHFSIRCSSSSVIMEDLESTNGTAVNGQKMQTAVLTHGDQISAGFTRFVVVIQT